MMGMRGPTHRSLRYPVARKTVVTFAQTESEALSAASDKISTRSDRSRLLGFAPIFPFWVINIAPAFFHVPLRVYILATFVGILPGTFAYAYLGQGLESVLMAAEQSGRDISLRDLITPEITIAFVALALVAAIPTVVKKFRNRKAD